MLTSTTEAASEALIELVPRAQAGDAEAWTELHVQYASVARQAVGRIIRHHESAEDVTQEVWMRAVRCIDQLREPEHFGGWLRRIAQRMALNAVQQKPSARKFQQSANISDWEGPDTVTLRDDALRDDREVLTCARARLAAEFPQDEEVIEKFYGEGLHLQEIADQEGRPIGTIKRRLHTARKRIREHVDFLSR